MKNKGYAKFAGANKVRYRKCGSGVRIDNQVFLGMTLHSNARNACGALLKQQILMVDLKLLSSLLPC